MLHAADLLTNRARLTPDREALVELQTDVRFTYSELNNRSNRLANFMRNELGVEKGDRVSILAQNGVIQLDLFYGLAKLGAIFAPLNWRLSPKELAYIINDCTPKVLIVGPEYVDTLAEFQPEIDVQHIMSMEGAQIPDAMVYENVVTAASSTEPTYAELSGEDCHCILYTSGTTGRPKGAMIPHRHVLWNCINTVSSWGLTEYDISPVFTPMFHAGGLFAFLTPIFYIGGKIVLGRAFDPDESLKIILEEQCTVILGVPTLFQMWRKSAVYQTADFNHVRFFISGGAPCPPKLIDAWREEKQVVFRQGFGLTEVGPNCFSMTDEESVPKTGSIGKTIMHSQMRLVDAHGEDVPTGEAGELWIKGPHVCSGYWNKPEATAEVLIDGWFKTGDMMRQDEDGFFYVVGRAKDMIISGGENVYAAEVETIFRRHDAVEDAALIGKLDEKWGEVGLMIVLLKSGAAATEETLIEFCRSHLAKYKVPKQIIFAESLPYSAYGKVVKAELRKQYL